MSIFDRAGKIAVYSTTVSRVWRRDQNRREQNTRSGWVGRRRAASETLAWDSAVKCEKKVSIMKKVYLVSAGIYQKSIFQRVCIVSDGRWKRKKKFSFVGMRELRWYTNILAQQLMKHSWILCPVEEQRPVLGVAITGSVPEITWKEELTSSSEWTWRRSRSLSLRGGIEGGCAVKPSSWLKLKSLSEEQKRDKRSRICGGCQDRRWL